MNYESSPRHRSLRTDYSSLGNTSVGHHAYSRQSHLQESSFSQGGDLYSNILDRVRQTMNSAGTVDSFAGSRSLNGMSGIGMQRRVGTVGGSGLGIGLSSQNRGMSGYGGVSNTQMTSRTYTGNYEGMYNTGLAAGQVTSSGGLNQSGAAGNGVTTTSSHEMNSDVNQGDVVSSLEQTEHAQLNEGDVSNEGNSFTMETKEISDGLQEDTSKDNE